MGQLQGLAEAFADHSLDLVRLETAKSDEIRLASGFGVGDPNDKNPIHRTVLAGRAGAGPGVAESGCVVAGQDHRGRGVPGARISVEALAHFSGCALFAWLYVRAYGFSLKGVGLMLGLGVASEVIQYLFTAGRNIEVSDLTWNTLGVGFGMLVGWVMSRRGNG